MKDLAPCPCAECRVLDRMPLQGIEDSFQLPLPWPTFDRFWRVRTALPHRFGQPCRILARGKMNSCLVEFQDGARVVTSRNYIRKIAR